MIRTTVGQAFLPAIELVSEGHSCPSRTNSNPLGGARMPRTRGFGQTRMSAPPKSRRPVLLRSPEKIGHTPLSPLVGCRLPSHGLTHLPLVPFPISNREANDAAAS